jgi:hypothetical protein
MQHWGTALIAPWLRLDRDQRRRATAATTDHSQVMATLLHVDLSSRHKAVTNASTEALSHNDRALLMRRDVDGEIERTARRSASDTAS